MASDAASAAVNAAAEQVIISGSSYPTWAIYISASAILLAAFGGAIWQRRISKQTLTFNILMEQLWDGDFISQRQKFIEVRDNTGRNDVKSYASPDKEESPEATAIRSILNNYELLALGVHSGVLDEAIFKRYLKTTVVKDYERICPYINELRKRAPRSFIEYETLYEMWRKQ